ncbi:MAG: methenyltetrahydrofolate cyclohydrolase [Desulfobacca sp.]|nr:methenyltetrahydrofolate cyclohydrolase [Desulfobacca sp.]
MLSELTIKQFLDKVASEEPVPGGGSIAALSASISAALIQMVGGLTQGKKSNPALDEIMAEVIRAASQLQGKLLEDIDRDAEAYARVMKAYRLPKGSEEEKKARGEAIQEALKEAARVPLSVAEAGAGLLRLAEIAVRQGNPNAVTDAAVGTLMARSAVLGALFNVRINLASIKDKAFANELNRKCDFLEKEVQEKEKVILSLANGIISKET